VTAPIELPIQQFIYCGFTGKSTSDADYNSTDSGSPRPTESATSKSPCFRSRQCTSNATPNSGSFLSRRIRICDARSTDGNSRNPGNPPSCP